MAAPIRKKPAHIPPRGQGNRPVIVFLTLCSKDRRPLLANAAAHEAIRFSWSMADHWLVGRYVILPDHLHLFCAPTRQSASLAQWIRFWKSMAARKTGQPGLWQQDFWDTQLRAGERYEEKWHYVRHNPVRHGLVSKPEEWPYQGELNVLAWHDA